MDIQDLATLFGISGRDHLVLFSTCEKFSSVCIGFQSFVDNNSTIWQYLFFLITQSAFFEISFELIKKFFCISLRIIVFFLFVLTEKELVIQTLQ